MQLIRRYPLFQKLDLPLERVRVLALYTGSPSDSKQWGCNASSNNTHSFPIAFTTQCFGMVCSAIFDSYPPGGNTECITTSLIVSLGQYRIRAGTTPNSILVTWLAAGYQPQWGVSDIPSGYSALCTFPVPFTTNDYVAIATGVMSSNDMTYGKENYVNNLIEDYISLSSVLFRVAHQNRPSLRYIAIGR